MDRLFTNEVSYIVAGAPYTQVTNLNTKFKGQTSKGQLFKEFFEKEGVLQKQFLFFYYRDKLRHSFSKMVLLCQIIITALHLIILGQ